MDRAEMDRAKETLKVEVRAAVAGEAKGSVALLLRPDRLPRAVVTDSLGVSTTRVISYVDLLATLDESATVSALAKEEINHVPLAVPPAGTLLVDLVERASTNTYIVTGYVPSEEYLFSLEQGAPGWQGKELTTYEITLPPLAYRAVWREEARGLAELSLCLLSPDLAGGPTPETNLFRWPFSNVYDSFGGVLEGVCWYEKGRIPTSLAGIPETLVKRFARIPNDADRYAGDLTLNAPPGAPTSYAGVLETIEDRGGIPHDWLVPAGRTVRQLHVQEGRHEQT